LQKGFEFGSELFPGKSSNHIIHHLAVLKEEKGWEFPDPIFSSHTLIGFHIQLADLDLALILNSDIFHDGCNNMTGAPPIDPELHKGGFWILDHFPLKILVSEGDINNVVFWSFRFHVMKISSAGQMDHPYL
jgi:hypothetical protein